MGKLFLEVITPEKVLVSEEVDIVVAPGSEGEFGVLPGHVEFLSAIVPGRLRYKTDGRETRLAVTAGFSEVSNDRVSIIVDAAEKAGDIDIERARKSMERAKERLAREKGTEGIDFSRADMALRRAAARIKVAEKTD